MKSTPKFLFPSFRELLALCFCVCLLLIAGVFSVVSRKSEADGSIPFTGYAWEASYLSGSAGDYGGTGWISFNCTNDNSCGNSPYQVQWNSDNTVTGYAWSSNYGWIKFGNLLAGTPQGTTFPTGPGTVSQDARLSGNNLTGWARVCSGTVNSDCTGASRSDFDGWISLSGTGYGPLLSTGGFTSNSYAWGGPSIGWIAFAPVTGDTGSYAKCHQNVCLGKNSSVTLSAANVAGTNPDGSVTADSGSTITVSWTTTDVPAGTLCTTRSSYPFDKVWPSTSRDIAGTVSYPVPDVDGLVLSISCPDGRGGNVQDSLAINLSTTDSNAPFASLQVSTSTVSGTEHYVTGTVSADLGSSILLKWSSNGYTTQCVPLSSGFSTGGAPSGTALINNISASQSYVVKCSNDSGLSRNASVTVNVLGGTGGCIDPAGGPGSPLIQPGATSTYYYAPQGKTCAPVDRVCQQDPNSGNYQLSGNANAVYTSCTVDPNYKEN